MSGYITKLQANKETIIKLLLDLSSEELSTLVAALNEPNSQIGTSKHSTNYCFLRKLVELELAEEIPLGSIMPPTVTSFRIKDDVKPDIADLLESAAGLTDET